MVLAPRGLGALRGGRRFVGQGTVPPQVTRVPAAVEPTSQSAHSKARGGRLRVRVLGASVVTPLERANARQEHEEDVRDDTHGQHDVDVLPLVSRKSIKVELVHDPVALRHVGVAPRARVVLRQKRLVKLVKHFRGDGVVQWVEVHEDALRPVDLRREDDDAVGGQHGHEHDVEEEGGDGGQVGEEQAHANGGHLARRHPDPQVEPVKHLVGGAVAVARHVVDDLRVPDGLKAAPEEHLRDAQARQQLHAVVHAGGHLPHVLLAVELRVREHHHAGEPGNLEHKGEQPLPRLHLAGAQLVIRGV
eukprot:6465805-Pyramimonas_sp.AAC.1